MVTIILTSIALVGIGVVQVYWIKWSLALEHKNFENKVFFALNNVKSFLAEEYVLKWGAKHDLRNNFKMHTLGKRDELGLNSLNKGLKYPSIMNQLMNTFSQQYPSSFLDNIDNHKLDKIVRTELLDQGIKSTYDYAIYSKKNDNFVILNGNYVVEIKNEGQSSNAGSEDGLYNSNYRINLYDDNRKAPGYLILYFPDKSSSLWSQSWGIILISLVLTLFLIGGFIYNVYTILRQKRVSEMRTDFINNMTHEFKTPIATISLASDALFNEKVRNERSKVDKFLGIIKQENTRMLNQVEKVLQIALLDKEEFQLNVVDVDIHELLNQTVEHSILQVNKRNGTITSKFDAEQFIVMGDITHLSNVFHNIMDNAYKYTEDVPDFHVSTKNVSKGIEIVFNDNGIGMSKDAVKHIYEKFYRVHTGNVHDVKGFGLGLSYVKKIIDEHKGKITVNSVHGEGTSFKLFLPFTTIKK